MRLKHAASLLPHRGVPWLWALFFAVYACADTVPRDAAVVIIVPREAEQLDPRFVGDPVGIKLTRILHASLVRMDPLTLEPVPDLAREVRVEGTTRYVVTLRPGLRFSDGSALDADDVVATFRALADPRVKSRYAGTYKRIARLERRSELEVAFELEAPHATFLTDLEVPILRAEDAFRAADPAHLPLGAGPYRLVARDPGHVRLARNPFHPARDGLAPTLSFVVIRDDNTRALRMLAGGGDLALNAVPPLLVPLFSRGSGLAVRSAPGIGTTYLGFNLRHPRLRDVRVRRAIALAIDRASLVRHKLNGRARLATGFVPPGHWAYAALPLGRHDPAAARALLDEAGVARGTQFTLRTGSDRNVVSMARALAAMLADVGLDVDVRPSESATLFADLGAGRFELTYAQLPELYEPHVLSWFFGSDRIPLPGKREGGNRWRYESPEFDAALERGRTQLARADRVRAYRDVQAIMARDLPVFPLWHDDVVAITSARLSRYRVPRDARFATLAEPMEAP